MTTSRGMFHASCTHGGLPIEMMHRLLTSFVHFPPLVSRSFLLSHSRIGIFPFVDYLPLPRNLPLHNRAVVLCVYFVVWNNIYCARTAGVNWTLSPACALCVCVSECVSCDL